MKEDDKIALFAGAIVVVVIFSAICINQTYQSQIPQDSYWQTYETEGTVDVTITNITDIYAMQCPFGQYYANTEGHWGQWGGSISTNLAEDYVVKYMVENELRTQVMPVTSTKVIVDGSLSSAIIVTVQGIILNGTSLENQQKYIDSEISVYSWSESARSSWYYSNYTKSYVYPFRITGVSYTYEIHLPSLPNTELTTDNWGN